MNLRPDHRAVPAAQHVIETLEWDCRFARKDLAMAQQDRLSRFLNGPGLRVVAEQFERMSPATEVWRIDRLEVDMGRLDANASLEQWSAQLQEQLWTSLQRQRREGTAEGAWRLQAAELTDPATPTPGSVLLSPSERDLDVFMHYLQQGHLPWSANQVVARDLADWLTRMALHHGLRLWQRLQQAQPSAQVLQRLCHISPHSGLQALIAVRHPDLAASLEVLDSELLAPLHASGRISAYQLSQLQQRYRVAGLHALWGLSGSALSAARHQALQQALVQAHRDWLAPSWSEAWRSSLGRTQPQVAGPAVGGDLARMLLQTLLGGPADVSVDPPAGRASSPGAEQVSTDLSHLQAVLNGSRPLDSVRLGELLDRLQSLRGADRIRLGQALRLLARNQAMRLNWARQLGAMHVWRLIQLMQNMLPAPVAGQSAGLLEQDETGQTERPQQAAWQASSSWAESLRQFALRMNGSVHGAARPGLSRLQSQLLNHSLRYLAQHGRLPQDHVAWQALWHQAWSALHGDPPCMSLRARRDVKRVRRHVEALQAEGRLEALTRSPGDESMPPSDHLIDPVAALQIDLLAHSLRQAALSAVPDLNAAWQPAWQAWQSMPHQANHAPSAQPAPNALRAELRRRAWHRSWRWHVATSWSEERKIELLRLLLPSPDPQSDAGEAWAWLPDATRNVHRLGCVFDAPAGLPDAAWLWAGAIEWAVQQTPGKLPVPGGVQAHWAKQWRALHAAEDGRACRSLAGDAHPPIRSRAQPGPIRRHRLRDADGRWQLVTSATNATLLECLASCVGCPPSRLTWFEAAIQGAARLGGQGLPSDPGRLEEPWARALLWSFSLAVMADVAVPGASGPEAQDPRSEQVARLLIESRAQAHWAALLGLITHALPTWWRQWSFQQTVRQRSPVPSRLHADLLGDLRLRSARYLAAQAWSFDAPDGPAKQIDICQKALLKMWPRWTRAGSGGGQSEGETPVASTAASSVGSPSHDPARSAHPAHSPPPPFAALDHLLSRSVATLRPADRLQLAELMQTEAACARWLATHDEGQRWEWLHAQFGRGAAVLKQCSEPLLVALRMACPQLTAQEAHALHWQHLAQHLFVEGLPPEPGLLARRYAMRLCQRDLDLAGGASQSWQRWLHRMRQALMQTQSTASQPRTLKAMQAALQAPPRACEQWEASLSPAQRAEPLSHLDAALSGPALRRPPAKAQADRSAGQAAVTPHAAASGRDPIYTPTAGLVLLGGYVQRVFAALQLTAHSSFVDEAARIRAVHCLEYLAWGTTQGTEPDWVLSKMLCGVPLDQPLPPCDGLDSATCELLDSLLRAVIEHWKTIGNTSVTGLRQSFLQRAGRLTTKESDLSDQWQLKVEPRAFDMLLDRLPWSYSTIKMPWMAGALHVDWR